MVTTGTTKRCPLIARLSSTPIPVKRDQAAGKIIELLKDHPVVVVSGACHNAFDPNTQIGKTLMARQQLLPLLKASGVKASYLNLRFVVLAEDVAPNIFSLEYAKKFGNYFGEADVYLFDEVQFLLPKKTHSQDQLNFRHKFWEKVKELLGANKRIVFITAFNPQNLSYYNLLFNEDAYCFFSAPVVELPAQVN